MYGDGSEQQEQQQNREKEDLSFEAISHFIRANPDLSAGNLQSFNYYLEHEMISIILDNSVLKFPQCTITLKNPQLGVCCHVEKDGTIHEVLPNECRLRNLTYGCPIFVTVDRTPNFQYLTEASSLSSSTPLQPEQQQQQEQQMDIDDHLPLQQEEQTKDIEAQSLSKWIPTAASDRIKLCFHPILVKSSNCRLSTMTKDQLIQIAHEDPIDPGGYAIVRGTEREICSIRKMINNHIYISKKAQAPHAMWNVEVRSTLDYAFRPTATLFFHMPCADSPQKVTLLLPYLKRDIPLLVLFKALDVHDPKRWWHYLTCFMNLVFVRKPDSPVSDKLMREWLQPTLDDLPPEVKTREDALEYIALLANQPSQHSEKRQRDAIDLLTKEFLPHLLDQEHRCYYVGFVFCRLMRVFFKKDVDDRDDFGTQKVEQVGVLFASLFRMCFKKFMVKMRQVVQAELDRQSNFSCKTLFERYSKIITGGLKFALSTGNWGVLRSGKTAKTGVTQTVNRLNMYTLISSMRRMRTPLGRDGKLAKPRQLHASSKNLTDPSETPEGSDCGLVAHFSVLSTASLPSPREILIDFCLLQANVKPFSSTYSNPDVTSPAAALRTLVFVNGCLIGYHDQPDHLCHILRMTRRRLAIDPHVSIVHYKRERQVWIRSDRGRLLRPVFVVDRQTQTVPALEHQLKAVGGQQAFQWSDWWQRGWLEYMDAAEAQTVMIADSYRELQRGQTKFDYCELHPSVMLGLISNVIPFVGHNQSPRITYQCAMRKQAIGMPAHNLEFRMDTQTMTLDTPQRPLVTTRYEHLLGLDEHPVAQNYIVAIMPQRQEEDAVLLNKAALDRGLGRITIKDTYKATANKPPANQHHHQKDGASVGGERILRWTKPDETVLSALGASKQSQMYDKLDEDGIVSPGQFVSDVDALMGRFMQLSSTHNANNRADDLLLSRKHGIESILASSNNNNNNNGKEDQDKQKENNKKEKNEDDNNDDDDDDDDDDEEMMDLDDENKTLSTALKQGRLGKEMSRETVRYQNSSVFMKHGKSGVVHSVMVTDNEVGQTLVKVTVRSSKRPQVGDKFAAAPGQKGVAAIILDEVDMPFVATTGMVPDIIVPPHAFPSRMTIGEFLEGTDAKVAALFGKIMDATAFKGDSMRDFIDHMLQSKGYASDGSEMMISGTTGEPMGMVTVVPIYYQRLRHLSEFKYHARATGPVRADTHQPLEGRCRDGGLRYGEMERDNGISHGVSDVLRGRLFTDSDPHSMWICDQCGMFGQCRRDEREPYCYVCKSGQYMQFVDIPYATKVFLQEVSALHVLPMLHTTPHQLASKQK